MLRFIGRVLLGPFLLCMVIALARLLLAAARLLMLLVGAFMILSSGINSPEVSHFFRHTLARWDIR